MKLYLKSALLLFLLVCTQINFAGTTNEDIFSKALKAYDEVIKENKKIFGKDKGSKNEKADAGKKITKEQYGGFKKKLDNAVELFDQYLRVSNNTAHKKAARFYLLNLKKIDLASTNDLGQYRANYKKINSLNNELNTVRGYYFPLRYKSKGKSYIIKFKAKTSLERQLLVQFTEASAFSYHKADAAKWAKKTYPFYKYGDYNLWWSAHMWFHNYSSLYKTDAELVEASEKLIYSMSGLKRSDIKAILDSNYANYTHAYKKLNSVLKRKPELSKNGEVWANAAESFEKLDKDNWAMEYYNNALAAGYGNKSFLLKMMSKGKKQKNKDLVKKAAQIFDSKNLYNVSYSCTEYNIIADYFEYAGEGYKATELKDKYKKCDKALTKEQRRRARGGRFYVSFAPLAPISKNLQGSIQIGGNRRLHEFGIKQTNSQRVIGVDDEDFKWGGLSYYYTYKKFISDGMYLGFQLRYTDRKYEPLNATIRNTSTNARSTQTFNPTETRYDFTFHFGAIYATRLFHIEYYTGFGLGYYTFDGGSAAWDNTNFEITNRDVLNDRGNSPLGLTLRMGLQLGLNFINK
jgi:hypothetical protein